MEATQCPGPYCYSCQRPAAIRAFDVDLEIGAAVAVHIAFDDAMTSRPDDMQFADLVMESLLGNALERLIASGRRPRVDRRQVYFVIIVRKVCHHIPRHGGHVGFSNFVGGNAKIFEFATFPARSFSR